LTVDLNMPLPTQWRVCSEKSVQNRGKKTGGKKLIQKDGAEGTKKEKKKNDKKNRRREKKRVQKYPPHGGRGKGRCKRPGNPNINSGKGGTEC